MDKGPWCVQTTSSGGRMTVASGDFERDVMLIVDGDFSDADERREYALWLANRLNAAPDMAEALRRLIAAYSAQASSKDRADCWEQARAALAKAGL